MTEPTREFLFSYRFNGSDWSTTVFARDEAEAKEKIKQVGLARYDGEVFLRVPATVSGGVFVRGLVWLQNLRRTWKSA